MIALLSLLLACGPGPGEYDDGVYHCCAEGDGTGCCDGYEQGMCFEYGGIYGECIEQGEMLEAKVLCAFCCEGLEFLEPMEESIEDCGDHYPEGCCPSATPSLFYCAACGDGDCAAGENHCNCPQDCGEGG
jgi:hypothetical protein